MKTRWKLEEVESELRGISETLPKGEYRNVFNEYNRDHVRRFTFFLNKLNDSGISENARILDAGCFPGHVSLLLRKRGYSVDAIDQDMRGFPAFKILKTHFGNMVFHIHGAIWKRSMPIFPAITSILSFVRKLSSIYVIIRFMR